MVVNKRKAPRHGILKSPNPFPIFSWIDSKLKVNLLWRRDITDKVDVYFLWQGSGIGVTSIFEVWFFHTTMVLDIKMVWGSSSNRLISKPSSISSILGVFPSHNRKDLWYCMQFLRLSGKTRNGRIFFNKIIDPSKTFCNKMLLMEMPIGYAQVKQLSFLEWYLAQLKCIGAFGYVVFVDCASGVTPKLPTFSGYYYI